MAKNSPEHDTLLGGRVVRRKLPTFASPPGGVAPLEKRLLLGQGELAQFYGGEEPIHYIAAIELKAGAARGHHFHKAKKEWVYVVSGELVLKIGDTRSGQAQSALLTAGDLVLIPPDVAHALEPVTDGLAVEFSPTPFDPSDTYRHRLD